MSKTRNHFKDVLFGVSVGDALGVPYEFKDRKEILRNPAIDMIGYGTYNLPSGTWSDDSSLTFCLAEALTLEEFDLRVLSKNFENWLYHNYWTPRGEVFDVGITTQEAINKYSDQTKPETAGGMSVYSNGNGSLMRILPLVFHIKNKTIEERFEITDKVSSMTHGHIRSVISCFYYLEFARKLIAGIDKFKIYADLQSIVSQYLQTREINEKEIILFNRLFSEKIYDLKESEISGSGYVIHALEASIWCLLTTDNYKDAVLKAVNLGDDTDTTAAITGGLAGLLYSYETIPKNWVEQIARHEDIEDLANRMEKRYMQII